MSEKFFRDRAKEVRDLAEKADPFTKRRLLNLADKYDVKGGNPSRASRELAAEVVPLDPNS
jgi:hypothetical protein